MNREGHQIDAMTHRLAECPPDFLEPPTKQGAGIIDVPAIVCDCLRKMGIENVTDTAKTIHNFDARRQQLVAVTAWLLYDEWFLKLSEIGNAARELLVSNQLAQLSQLVRVEALVDDPDRREELSRICLRELSLRPAGETETEATDRLNALDSVERERVVRKTRAAEARAREIREKMAEQAAREAAARYTRE